MLWVLFSCFCDVFFWWSCLVGGFCWDWVWGCCFVVVVDWWVWVFCGGLVWFGVFCVVFWLFCCVVLRGFEFGLGFCRGWFLWCLFVGFDDILLGFFFVVFWLGWWEFWDMKWLEGLCFFVCVFVIGCVVFCGGDVVGRVWCFGEVVVIWMKLLVGGLLLSVGFWVVCWWDYFIILLDFILR